MFYLAECYWEGLLGLQIDHERSFNLYQSAAKLNHAPSAYRTAGTTPPPPHLVFICIHINTLFSML